jgi:hypothetical protein
LENTAATARSLDQLMLELEALMLKAKVLQIAVIVSLGGFSLLLELALVLALFRPAVNRSFSELYTCIGRLLTMDVGTVKELHVVKPSTFYCGGQTHKINPDATIRNEPSKRSAVGQYYCVVVVSSLLIVVMYFSLSGLMGALEACSSVLSRSRREYLWNRQLYLSEELLLAHNPVASLVMDYTEAGSLTSASRSLIRCELESASRGLLALHYTILYGGKIGWDLLPPAYNWLNALGAPLRWADAWTQVAANVWSIELCWPFTWNRDRCSRLR